MAKKSSIQTNMNRERMVKKALTARKRLKEKACDREASLEERFAATLKLAQMPRNGARIRVRRRCFLTGRSRGVLREYGLSRIKFRELASAGRLPGVTKASW